MSEKPNILLIVTDQHRLSGIGCYGDTPCKTPNIDRLAREGTRFETAYTPFPVCSPARASIITGQYAHKHGLSANSHTIGASVHSIVDRPQLLSRRLQTNGYFCGYTGKWHLGDQRETIFNTPNFQSLPSSVGFTGQDFPGHGNGGHHYPEYQNYLKENGYEIEYTHQEEFAIGVRLGRFDAPAEATVPYFLTNHTIELIDQAEDPFFIWHNFWGPHEPYDIPESYYEMYKDVAIPQWANFEWASREIAGPHQIKVHAEGDQLEWADWEEALRHYYAFTTLIDEQIGRLYEHLEATNKLDNTIIIFTADHGETLGSHGGMTDKGWSFFEEIQRVPFIVCHPNGQRNVVRDEFISLVDLYPTILDYAGIEATDHHGLSLRPLVKGESIAWRDSVVTEFFGLGGLSANMISIRQGNMKYGWNASGNDELYDFDTDPHEMVNQISNEDYADSLQNLRQALDTWMIDTKYKGISMYRQSRKF